MQEFNERLLKVELDVENLASTVKEMTNSFKDMSSELHAIQKHLNQIKYFALGAVALGATNAGPVLKLLGA